MIWIWEKALASIRGRVTEDNFHTYFEPLRFVHLREDVVHLEVDDAFFRDWVTEHYSELLASALRSAAGRDLQVVIGVARRKVEQLSLSVAREDVAREDVAREAEAPVTIAPETGFPINETYRFGTFVVGPSNQFAHAACESVGNRPARAYNPLFIYGGTGLGKTHLLHAVANRLRDNNPAIRITYVSAEEFTNQVIKSISRQEMDGFRDRFRSRCDVLLVDDVHVLSGKERTQEEFFHTFNALHAARKQIVLTSDKFPHEIPGLEERLRTRFQWGLIADIKPPEFETRVAILKRKAERDALDLPDDVAFFLAHSIRSNVRELEGALIRLCAYASLTDREVTCDLARETLRNLLDSRAKALTIDSIMRLVAEHFDVKVVDLKGRRRQKVIVRPRSIAMFLCRKHTQASFPEIGRGFGGKDHSTVMAACKKIRQAVANDPAVRVEVETLERKLPN